MAKIRLIVVEVRQSHYVGDVKELESLIGKGYEIVACAALGENKLIYTLVMS
jgi:hypothetical protein